MESRQCVISIVTAIYLQIFITQDSPIHPCLFFEKLYPDGPNFDVGRIIDFVTDTNALYGVKIVNSSNKASYLSALVRQQ